MSAPADAPTNMSIRARSRITGPFIGSRNTNASAPSAEARTSTATKWKKESRASSSIRRAYLTPIRIYRGRDLGLFAQRLLHPALDLDYRPAIVPGGTGGIRMFSQIAAQVTDLWLAAQGWGASLDVTQLLQNKWARAAGMLALVWMTIWVIAYVY